ncbi:hypothetical protein ACVWZ6_007038 [Bradyrhizobium sp. GM6.1]
MLMVAPHNSSSIAARADVAADRPDPDVAEIDVPCIQAGVRAATSEAVMATLS